MFTDLEPCKIHTEHTVFNSDSLASVIDHCTENLIHVVDWIINEMLAYAASSGNPIADNVTPAFQAYLAADIESPSAETLAAVQTLLGA